MPQPDGRLAEVVRHSDAVTGGPGAIMFRDTTAPLARDDGLYEIVEHTCGLGEKDLALALELGPKGITVNTIPPGFIDTPMLRRSESKGLLGEGVEHHAARTPVRRAGRPEDIAAACAFLVRDEAGYITGQVIGVNGGRNT